MAEDCAFEEDSRFCSDAPLDDLTSPADVGGEEANAPLVDTPLDEHVKYPYIFGRIPFFVDEVLKLRDVEQRSVRAHCVGPVVQLILWSPVVHASVMFSFMGLGLLRQWHSESRKESDLDTSHPLWWFLLAGCTCLPLMYLEVHIAKYSSTWYSDKARKQFKENAVVANFNKRVALSRQRTSSILEVRASILRKESSQEELRESRGAETAGVERSSRRRTTLEVQQIYAGSAQLRHCLRCRTQVESGAEDQFCHCGRRLARGRLPIGWPCLPVRMIDFLLHHCCFPGVVAGWHKHQAQWYFDVWFVWLFGVGTVTLYSRLQANTFLGMFFYHSYLATSNEESCVRSIWEDTVRESFFMRRSVPLGAILIVIIVAQICHYAFGVVYYWPRRGWKTADHARWQFAGDSSRGRWSAWGRRFELEVNGPEKREESIGDLSDWEQWKDKFEGGEAIAHCANSKVVLRGPAGGPVCKNDGFHYNPSHADLPLTMKWVTSRHAYTTVAGEQLTSSTVMDGIAECCSMIIMLEMQMLELKDWVKADETIEAYQNDEDPTVEAAGEVIQAVRTLMSDAVNVTRCAFSRIFIYGTCFCGFHLHVQVTYANLFCTGGESCRLGQSLCVGIGFAFVSMAMVMIKVFDIAKYLRQAWRIFMLYSYRKVLRPEHEGLVRFQAMQDQISRDSKRLFSFSLLLVPACLMFVWNLIWLLAKWIMETFVCSSHMWNWPPNMDVMHVMRGCVEFSEKTKGYCNMSK